MEGLLVDDDVVGHGGGAQTCLGMGVEGVGRAERPWEKSRGWGDALQPWPERRPLSPALAGRIALQTAMTAAPSPAASPNSSHGDAQPSKAPATGVQAAGMRAVAARMVAFYFRAPVKAFFRGRIDYMGYARAINPHVAAQASWSWRMTTPAVLAHAVRVQGWAFIPKQVLPPLMANTGYAAVPAALQAQAHGD